jgi:site-specific recombinase XerD
MHSHSPMMGPLAPYAEGFRAWLVLLGFAPASVKHRLTLFRQFSRWLVTQGVGLGELTDQQAERFVAARRAQGRVTWVSPAGMALPLRYLRGLGVVPPAAVRTGDLLGEWLAAYGRYLIAERGLAASTVGCYLRVARRFLAGSATQATLEQLTAADVTAFVVAECGRSAGASANKTVTALGSLLRYLYIAGLTAVPLAAAVPRVAPRRPAPMAQGIAARQVACLLSGCDRRTSHGRRDFAILLLLARLGLRAGEVAALTLDDFHWRAGEVEIHGKGNRHELLPLPDDVGQAVAGYLRRGRTRVPDGCRAVFVRLQAPWGRLGPSGVCQVVRTACQRAGLPEVGAHRLRHTTATGMLRAGAGLAEIAQALRHRSLAVTAGYAQPDPHALGELARPWPGGAA